METKRIKFALFTCCIFILFGCVSAFSIQTEQSTDDIGIKNSRSLDAGLLDKYIGDSTQESIENLAFRAYDPMQGDEFFKKIRNEKGELFSKVGIEQFSGKLYQKVKGEIAQSEALAKKQEEERQKALEKDRKTLHSLKITTYGVDCYGCGGQNGRGGTSMGVLLDIQKGVLMPNGLWQPGIKYGNYYIVAADKRIPLCSILKISNHGLSGSGISPNEPYYAIVLDRGGAVIGSHIDLFVGSENSQAVIPVQKTIATAEIMRMGGKNGKASCAL